MAGRHGRRKVFQLATEKGRRYDKGREQCPFTEIAKTDGRIAFFSQVLTKLQAAEQGIHHFIFTHGVPAGPKMAAVHDFQILDAL